MKSADYPEEMDRLRTVIYRLRAAAKALLDEQTDENATALQRTLDDPENKP